MTSKASGRPASRWAADIYRAAAMLTFLALPRLPMAVVLYLDEEGLSPSVNVLFDATAAEYLPTEDLILIGEYLSAALLAHKGAEVAVERISILTGGMRWQKL